MSPSSGDCRPTRLIAAFHREFLIVERYVGFTPKSGRFWLSLCNGSKGQLSATSSRPLNAGNIPPECPLFARNSPLTVVNFSPRARCPLCARKLPLGFRRFDVQLRTASGQKRKPA
jgi:hypothetical protein